MRAARRSLRWVSALPAAALTSPAKIDSRGDAEGAEKRNSFENSGEWSENRASLLGAPCLAGALEAIWRSVGLRYNHKG